MKVNQKDIKRVFWKLGTCSRTLFYIINREFEHPMETEEQAIDPLAGGIIQQGYQCGMLWGASMAVGAESFRRFKNQRKAISITVNTTQRLMESFSNKAGSIECYDITSCNFKSKLGIAKLLLSGKFLFCFKLAQEWAPEAIRVTEKGLLNGTDDLDGPVISCASEVTRKMGASDEEMVLVSGFAGGMGLSGNGCGALGAAIWMTILEEVRKNRWKYSLSNPITENILDKFFKATEYQMLCSEITGESFQTISDHTEFIKNGGCEKLISVLAQS